MNSEPVQTSEDTFYTDIEAHFTADHRTPMMLSPKDWSFLEDLRNNGISKSAIIRGISRTLERRQRMQRVNSLRYCEQAILEIARHEPEPRPSVEIPERQSEVEYIEEQIGVLIERIKSGLHPSLERVCQGIVDRLRKVVEIGESEWSLIDVEATLAELTALMVATATNVTGAPYREEIRDEARSRASRNAAMGTQLWSQLTLQHLADLYLKHYRLPYLSLSRRL